jgi:hypothetical protein
MRSRLGALGIQPHIAELTIGHSSHKTGLVGTYDRYDYGREIKDALAIWANALTAIIEPSPAGNVTPMRRATA